MEDKKPEIASKELLEKAQSIIVCLPPDPGKDLVAAGVSLFLSLRESGKKVQIGCGSEVHIDDQIEGISTISDTIGSRNLIISFDYHEDDLEKVDYDVREDGKFYLLVKPKAGSPIPDINSVKYSYSGADADLVITLGINSLEELGKIYADEKNFLDHTETLSLNTSLRPSAFTSNQYHQNSGSYSELVATLLEKYRLKTPSTAANNLLNSIYEVSSNLTSSRLTADTFATIAFLLRSGASLPNQQERTTPRFSQPPFFEVPTAPEEENIPLPEEENSPVPSDWNKPKIFRVGSKQKAS